MPPVFPLSKSRRLEKFEIYDKLWSDAALAFERSEHSIDSHVSDKTNDLRRGVTLVLRPAEPARSAVADYIGQLREICPEQYFYQPEELHVTVLSIITMTQLWQQEMERFEACRPIIRDVLGRQRSFKIRFQGVTASRDSVLIQGFPMDNGLAAIRDALREAFGRAGFGDMIDRRYKVTAAHMSIMRFSRQCLEMKRLFAFLKESREAELGQCEISSLELILGDWYASADRVKTLEEYQFLSKSLARAWPKQT